ncbi:uncharacterized protein UV8b_00682 [Ustilaginoidea virens]|uniref:Uncharacterized protein n=1 Tax=Ustilaginoidea virens TaxID=1159556 RepID=A0A063BXK7_USTVR|nr:uncharacterized protein UV8b_00682 [Ustilaginoidea virens]QUC16441.1 hypothetical protein UV8b_00682 [Ustilaginoidea virens]GAO13339.1 hypothetical protein UVI_02013500 [Ustilaginoidea virens]
MSSPDDPDWNWFPNVKTSWSLDVVNLLVVIGESSIAEHAQAITASLPGMLPRILPAPQVLLKPSRPTRMPETHARMTGVYSGTTLDSVGFFANIITPLDNLPPFSFKVLDIEHADSVDAQRAPCKSAGGPNAFFTSLARLVQRRGPGNRACVGNERDSDEEEQEKHAAAESVGPAHQHHLLDEESAPATTEPGAGKGDVRQSTETSPRRQRTVRTVQTTDEALLAGMPDEASQASPASTPSPSGCSAPRRASTSRRRCAQDLFASPTVAVGGSRPAVPAKLLSPVHVLSVFSCLLSIGIIVAAAINRDGTAVLAVTLVSLASTIAGYASSWRPLLMKRKHTNEVPRGDVLIRTREGAFVLVRCSEEVARELYSGTEECEYRVGGNAYRALMALGTMTLMISVVLLGNCTWELKVLIGSSYIVLNGLYWGLGMMPRSCFWDLSRYRWRDVTPDDAASAHCVTRHHDQREGHPCFTRTLWYAIRETKLTGWVERSGAAPSTDQWRKWLREAGEAAVSGRRDWPAVQRKNSILKEDLGGRGTLDRAAQHAPATEVRPPPETRQ